MFLYFSENENKHNKKSEYFETAKDQSRVEYTYSKNLAAPL